MKRFFKIAGVISLLAIAGFAFLMYVVLPQKEAAYQADAARKRVSDIYEVASLLEECKSKQGTYPFVRALQQPASVPVAVMLSQPDQDWVQKRFPFTMGVSKHPASALINELSSCLQRKVDLPIDPQRRPHLAPNTYIVMFTKDNSYVALAFLHDKHPYSSPLTKNVYVLAISSPPGSEALSMLRDMRIVPKMFVEIPAAEVAAAREEGKKMDQMFSKWAATRVDK